MDLKSFFKRKPEAPRATASEPNGAPLTPDQAHFVIGDVHGRADLLERMLEKVDRVIGEDRVANPVLCFVGNIIDFGPDSHLVLQRITELTGEFAENILCLMGNHEQMLLDFLQAPAARLSRWMREGGDATCRSFGLDAALAADPDSLASELKLAIGTDHLAWMERRPLSHQSGNLFVVHAGADPVRAIDDQTDRVKIWGHPEFLTRPRVDGAWVAHGHHVVERPHVKDARISVNTEAWRTGVLSCAYVATSGDVRFIQAVAGS